MIFLSFGAADFDDNGILSGFFIRFFIAHIVQIQKLAKLRQDYENAGKSYLDAGIMNAEQAKEFKAPSESPQGLLPG